MTTACYRQEFADSNCVKLDRDGKDIFRQLFDLLCKEFGTDYRSCKPLQNVFIYTNMKSGWGIGGFETCGFTFTWCRPGKDFSDQFALCFIQKNVASFFIVNYFKIYRHSK